MEIERKYLLKSSSIVEFLQAEGLFLHKENIEQIYTNISHASETRIRKIDDKYFLTTKLGDGLVRDEKEEKISQKIYTSLKKKALGSCIYKTRYSFKLQNLPTCIDVYLQDLQGLCVLEIEFFDQKSADEYVLPNFLLQYVKQELTGKKRFKNSSLCLYGSPFFKNNLTLDDIFLHVNQEQNEYINEIPFNHEAYGAIRIVFFSLYKKVVHFQKQYQNEQNVQSLHQFRVNIRKIRSILQSIDGVFEQNIKQRFVDDLKTIANATNLKRDFDVFMQYLQDQDELEAECIYEIVKNEQKEQNAALDMLKSEFYHTIMQEFEVVLMDNDNFFCGMLAQFPYKKLVAMSLYNRLKKMRKKLSMIDEHVSLEYFHDVRIEFKRLRYIMESFGNMFVEMKQVMKISKNMQNLFGQLQDKDVGLQIIQNLEQDEKYISCVESVRAFEIVKQMIKNEIYVYKMEILYGKEKLFKLINKNIKSLKVYM